MGSVDTSLHPYATGTAAKTVEAHAERCALKLWAGWFCPFVQRSWMVLEEKSIPYQYHEVNPYKKEADFLALNPRGLVPTLACPVSQDESKPLYESNIICEYLDEVYSDTAQHGQRLLPEDLYEKARCRIWIDFVGSKIIPAFYRWLQHQPNKSYSIDEAKDEFWGHVRTFVKEMDTSGSGPWFLGKRFSMVDVAIAPWIVRLFLIEHYKPGGLQCPNPDAEEMDEKDQKVWRRWRGFVDAIEGRNSVKDTLSDRESYVDAYKRYAEDKTMSQVGQATRQGRRLP